MISKDIGVEKNRWRSCLVTAPLIAVAVQSACTLCPPQTLLWPFLSNTLQASSSFKQNPPDTFIIASSLIRDPAQIWMNKSHRRLCRTVTHEQKLRHIISVSLLPAWLIDCGCSDTLCRIGILPLIGADTNSSRTVEIEGTEAAPANDFDGRHLQMWETPHGCHFAFCSGHVYIVHAPVQRWQSADVWHMRCESHLTITPKEWIGLKIRVKNEVYDAHLKQS